MDQMQAAQALGVAAYTVVDVKYHFEREGWVVKVRDMATHDIVERFLPGEYLPPFVDATDAAEPDDTPHGETLAEMAFDGAEVSRIVNLTVPEITAWVGQDDVRALAVLIAEEQRDKPRKTLVEALQPLLDAAEKAAPEQ